MELKPIGDKVIVEVIEAINKSKGGIIFPDTAKEKPQHGKVISVGRGKTLSNGKIIPPRVAEGDRIIFGKYSGNEVKVEDKEYLIIDEDDVLATVVK